LPEYYLTRAERAIFEAHADEIAARVPADVTVVELGSGSAVKTRILLEALLASRQHLRYVPIDISSAALAESAWALLRDYEGLEIRAVAGEYAEGLGVVRRDIAEPRLVLWLGSNIGNLDGDSAVRFLRRLRGLLGRNDRVLCGIDLRKPKDVLERAYDDASGVTARFNKNLLARINRELGGDFDLEAFTHRAVYEDGPGRVAMYLVSRRAQRVHVDALEGDVEFAAGETIHTEDSYKYSLPEIDRLAARAGLSGNARWLDPDQRFALSLFAPIAARA
jgi:dimethylhistidine N-methyltransferase